jgi:exodeoxyribonuclease VII small subunit
MPPRNPASPGTPEPREGPSFEEALERLETVVSELESGSLTLEQSIARYEEGMRLSQRLTQQLDEAEKRIERLVEAADGRITTEPMDLEAEGQEPPPVAPRQEPRSRDARGARPSSPRPRPNAEADELPF